MRTVYASSLTFPSSADPIWAAAVEWVRGWYVRKAAGTALPDGWSNGTVEPVIPLPGHSLAVSVDVDGSGSALMELRWRYPDSTDPSLLWSSEVSVFQGGQSTLFTLLLRIASVDFDLSPVRYQLGTPRVVRTLVARGDAHIGTEPLSLRPREVAPPDVPQLVQTLFSEHRRHPVVVLSPDPYRENCSVDPVVIANTLAGVASVVVLASKWAGFALTDELGKQYSCFNGAVRVYWPHFKLDADPFVHRLWLPAGISEYGGSENFASTLLRLIAAVASFRFVEPEAIRSFRLARERARVEALKNERDGNYDSLFKEYDALEVKAKDLAEQLEIARRENENLRENLAAVWTARAAEPVAAEPAVAIGDRPDVHSVKDAVEEAQKRTNQLVYLDEAFSSARESPFKQPDKVYSALMAIDDVACQWAAQLKGGPAVGPRMEAFRQRGFDYKDDISKTSAGKWGSKYTYYYKDKKTVFAAHITIGAKQPDKCLSIHMHWDDADRVVVIAHVGRHKTNTRS